MTDGELLRRYARDGSETCFAELVQRHIPLIYSAALRQVNNDSQQAEDVVQAVFTDLAGKAERLAGHPSLTGWLYTTTRFAAANLRRSEQRRARREQEAVTMNQLNHTPEPDWTAIRPWLDEAMHSLSEPDRQAVLLRHFENRSYAEIGASLGVTESGARMRVERALAKLSGSLAKRGVTSTTVALAGLLAAHAVGVVPGPLTARVVKGALSGAAAGGSSVWLTHMLAVAKSKLVPGLAAIVVTGLVLLVAYRHVRRTAPPAVAALSAPLNSDPVAAIASAVATNTPIPAILPVAAKSIPNGLVLHLEIVTADTGQPIPLVPIDYRGWEGKKFTGHHLMSDRFGRCDVIYPTNTTELGLTTRKDDFADTQLFWRPPHGEMIPAAYVARVDRPVRIGGVVLGPDGQPVAGAHVGWNHEEDPRTIKSPQNHEFGWIETWTDATGHWQLNRIAGDMLSRIYGSADHSNYTGSTMVFAGQDKTAEKQLRQGTLVFTLGRAATVSGVVTDEAGVPVAQARVMVGGYGWAGSRTSQSGMDGTFSVAGSPPGRQSLTADAPGFAPTTVAVQVGEQTPPVHLILNPGKMLRLRVVDAAGSPIPRAQIWHDNFSQAFSMEGQDRPETVQIDFSPTTDAEGRAVLTNAPDTDLKFDVEATGFRRQNGLIIHPDGEEHVITLSNATLVVHGIVWDAATGNRIPHVRIALGTPRVNPVDGTTNAQLSPLERYWLDFTGGTYRQDVEEAVETGMDSEGYVLKFMADNHAPYVSRVIRPEEGDVELNVSLQPAASVTVAVVNPDGQPTVAADVGLVSPGTKLELIPGGLARDSGQVNGNPLRTDGQGNVVLPPDDSITRVIAAAPAGYAESTLAELAAHPLLQLQPWGSLQVTCGTAGTPPVAQYYELEMGGGRDSGINFEPQMARLKPDAEGHISLPQLPPGHHQLKRIYPFADDNGESGSWNGDETAFDIRSGETTTLDLAASKHTVTARLQWPAGLARQAQWQVRASLRTQPWTGEMATPGGRFYLATPNADDTLVLENVAPGDYELSVFVEATPAIQRPPGYVVAGNHVQLLATGTVTVPVPADPPTGTVEAGTVALQAATGTDGQ